MQGQESSSSSSSNQTRANKLLQKYANTDLDKLPESIIQELKEEDFLAVDISGAMKLTNVSILPPDCLQQTLLQSLDKEEEPFNNETSKNFLAALNRINHEMLTTVLLSEFIIIFNRDAIESLPKYFYKKYDLLDKKFKKKLHCYLNIELIITL